MKVPFAGVPPSLLSITAAAPPTTQYSSTHSNALPVDITLHVRVVEVIDSVPASVFAVNVTKSRPVSVAHAGVW